MAQGERSWLSESLLIVISILVAFAIDAWWSERSDRAEERRVLATLRAEFQVNADKLPRYIDAHRRSERNALELIAALSDVGPDGRVSFEGSRLMWLTAHSSTDPQRGALDAVLQSGELRYIQSQAIRERLAGWPQKIIDAVENEELLRKTWGPLFNQALVQRVDLARTMAFDEQCWLEFDETRCAIGSFDIPYSTELIGYLTHIRGFSAEAARELELLREEALDIVQLLDRELALLD